ncbi:hypothetical protein [Burkholderia multivorans]|uniref:hypothetical protein n=1 Tax=Burkholderia multivorans TaxID=87883 RepID=UPI0015E368C9|nr:hypothetical protein [Burkholderia multivorans]MBU9143171.1 hypothetical protein [Burkholderia multivorans]MBU9513455.1 hypothetical protein [Burkholderia multivorans]MBU9527869.1 hypothetical protein [Burkholderia multivorans]MBU9540000.1 hypothetical protein [Burkholderia multivorans]MBU9637259.1 hypothetical protein [Burkholderia multivorans]
MAAPLAGGARRKNRQLSRWRFFYARVPDGPAPPRARQARRGEIDKNLLISWTSARSSDRPYNSG